MARPYKPRRAPARFFDGAPEIVRKGVVGVYLNPRDTVLEYDVILSEGDGENVIGLDFGTYGWVGCHFFLRPHEYRGYNARNRRKRVAWADLPAKTRDSIVDYLEQ
jgi:hypothetical protein